MNAPPPNQDLASMTAAPAAQADVGSAALLVRVLRTLAGRAGIVAISFAFAVVLTRALSPAARGNFALLQALMDTSAILANVAVGKAAIHHLGKGTLPLESAMNEAALLSLASGAVAAAVLVPIAIELRSTLLPGIAPALILAAVLLATPRVLREYVGGVQTAVGRPQDYVGASAVQPGGALVILVAVLLLGRGTFSSVVAAWGGGIVLSAIAAVTLTARYSSLRARPRRRHLVLLGSFGAKTYPAMVARFLNLRLDQFLVRWLTSASILGQYAVAVSVGELLIRVPGMMLWAISGAISAKERERSGDLVVQFCRWTILILFVAATAVAVATPIAVPLLFGAEYRPAVPSVLLLLPGMVFYAPALLIMEYFIVQRAEPGKAALIAGTSLLTSTALNFPLAPALGAAGAAIASSISYGVMLATAAFLFARDTGRRPTTILEVHPADVRAVVVAGVAAMRRGSPRDGKRTGPD